MLFAGGIAIPPGTRNLGDVIDQTDPCTLNPSDPICQLTAGDVAADPCKTNPTGPNCQAAIVQANSGSPMPGANDSQWSQFVDSATATPQWVTNLLNKISGTPSPGTSLNPTASTNSGMAASLLGIPFKPVVMVLILATVGFFGYERYKKKHRRAA